MRNRQALLKKTKRDHDRIASEIDTGGQERLCPSSVLCKIRKVRPDSNTVIPARLKWPLGEKASQNPLPLQ